MTLAAGTRLGPYEILGALGAGGMGEVYRARDARLNRDVAIKVLPDGFAHDVDRLARFKREAQVLASLNHTHIAAIYGIEESAGVTGLVLELVEGETLAETIARGPIPVAEAVPVARQIADALEAAHEHGIVHRDLKPANIKLTSDGHVKVLDFGLAKAMETESTSQMQIQSMSPTLSLHATHAGIILGTAAYMSPEQARGKLIDKKSDIWAFGCVVFEMLTGTRAFEGEEVSDTLAAVLRGEPEWSRLPRDTPPSLDAVLRRCLDKDRKKRIADIADVRFEIDRVPHPSSEPAPAAVPRLRKYFAWAIVGVLAGAAASAAVMWRLRPETPEVPVVRFSISPPSGWSFWTPSRAAGRSALAISSDGKRLVFLARDAKGKTQLWVRSLDALEATLLPGTENAESPFWSADNLSLGFFADGKLKAIRLAGGPPTMLSDAPDERGGAWNQEGTIIFSPCLGCALQKVSDKGGIPSELTKRAEGDSGHARPIFLPDGQHFLFRLTGGAGVTRPIFLASMQGERTKIMEGETGDFYYSRGHLLFLRGSSLMARPLDARSYTFTGEAFSVAEGVSNFGNANLFAASANGVIAFQPGTESLGSELLWVDRNGKSLGRFAETGNYDDLALSPDEKRLAVTRNDRPAADIWVYDVSRGVGDRLTTNPSLDAEAVWSPSGDSVIFDSNRVVGKTVLFEKMLSSFEPEKPIDLPTSQNRAFDRARDGSVVYQALSPEGNDIWVLPSSGDRKPFALMKTPFDEVRPKLSPDERWITYSSNRSGLQEVYVTSFPKPGEQIRVSTNGGTFARWRRDGREIFYIAPDGGLMAAAVDGSGAGFTVSAVHLLFPLTSGGSRYPYDVTKDGQRFIINMSKDPVSQQPLSVVVNWPASIKK